MPRTHSPERRAGILTGSLFLLTLIAGGLNAYLRDPILSRHSRTVALTYLSFRSIECVLLSAGAPADPQLAFLASLVLDTRYAGYPITMIFLGTCSVPMCLVLLRHRRVPGPIAVLGIAAYVCLFASGVLDLLGLMDTENGKGAMLYIPGGLSELAALPVWLLARGFTPAGAPSR